MDNVDRLIDPTLPNLGFLLGAGASYLDGKGYPLMPGLTTGVLQRIPADDLTALSKIVGGVLDVPKGEPDIEHIVDLLEERLAILPSDHSQYVNLSALSNKLRDALIEVLNSYQPSISVHTLFLRALSKLRGSHGEQLDILTTNYDLLLELGATSAQVHIVDGFSGASARFLDMETFHRVSGRIRPSGRRREFELLPQVVVHLFKLHGSIDWWKVPNDGSYRIYATTYHPFLDGNNTGVMVLPRRRKVIDVLEPPFANLWAIARAGLGRSCKYLIACGISFRDTHLVEQLLKPPLQERRMRLLAFVKQPSSELLELAKLPTVSWYSEHEHQIDGQQIAQGGAEWWNFERLVANIASSAGIM